MNPQPGQIWKHSKKGNLYKIITVGKHSESLEEMVVYEAQYENPVSKVWIRPLTMWNEEVEIEGKKVPRFVLVN
ncbi:MAG: hypothetical protein RLY57_636 [Candidatus Parcubacteria bacterium]|jgi:hypothetical protein